MRCRNYRFFLCKVAVERVTDDGVAKAFNETYAIDATGWGDAEHRIMEYLAPLCDGDIEIKEIRIADFSEVYFTDDANDDKWYSAKLEYITFDEVTLKEKRSVHTHLFQASSLDAASRMVNDVMKDTLIDFAKTAIKDAKITDVIELRKP